MEKQCNTCGELKPLSEFNKRNSTGDNYYAFCKKCRKDKQKDYRERKKNGQVILRQTKNDAPNTLNSNYRVCKICVIQKPLEQFEPYLLKGAVAYRYKCLDCIKIALKKKADNAIKDYPRLDFNQMIEDYYGQWSNTEILHELAVFDDIVSTIISRFKLANYSQIKYVKQALHEYSLKRGRAQDNYTVETQMDYICLVSKFKAVEQELKDSADPFDKLILQNYINQFIYYEEVINGQNNCK
jgi:hypothetical protein